MKHKLTILTFFIFLQEISLAQTKEIDSMLLALKTAKEDTNKVNILNNLSTELFLRSHYDAALRYGKAALSAGKKTNFKKGMTRAYLRIGAVNSDLGNYSEALENSYSALKLSIETGDKRLIALSYSTVAGLHMYLGNNSDALNNILASLKIREEIHDSSGIAQCNTIMGIIYQRENDYSEALKKCNC